MADTKKKNKPYTPAKTSAEEPQKTRRLTKSGLIGVVLLASALLNVPKILKTPETSADKMLLIIVLALALGGIILLLLGGVKDSEE